MENKNIENQPKSRNTWSLIAGIAFVGLGSYRVYNHFFIPDTSSNNFRLLLAIVFIGYGLYRLYTYFNNN
ncbi:hypothetical protein [Lacinutrix sp. Hel_I_90]|uniref:hypothetical protein n=1 Tax=Lacinutrix sp. Hel_I_90 TaxID=1249999 RepID=UPI0005CAA445|nr:hypothetical protein [Lacinutrix sp. Hel_I_90]